MLTPTPAKSLLEVSGKDAQKFLQNLLSNDISQLKVGESIPACFLNAQAKIIAHVQVIRLKPHFLLVLDPPVKDTVREYLEKLIILEEVQLNETINLTAAGIRKKVIPRDATPEERPKEFTDAMRIEWGFPKWGVDFDENTIPLECRLENTVSFSKGCYPGQEIVARLDSRGGVSKKLMKLVIHSQTVPVKGEKITKDGKEIGHITSAATSEDKVVALGYMKKGFWESGTEVEVEMKAGKSPANVIG